MPATFTLPLITVIPGQLITASLWNNEFENIDAGFTPSGLDDYSTTDADMQLQTDPFPGSVTSRPTSLAGEIERIRFQLAGIIGSTYWYEVGAADLNGLASRTSALEANFPVTTALITDGSVTPDKLAASVAGGGLVGGTGSPLSVNADGSTVEINSDILRVKASGITENEIASSIAGDGLSGGGGSALSVNVDGSTIETNSDSLRVKDAGITEAKLAAAVVAKLGISIGLVSRASLAVQAAQTSYQTIVDYAGQGRLMGIGDTYVNVSSTNVFTYQITIDGTAFEVSTDTLGSVHNGASGKIVFNGPSATVFDWQDGAGELDELGIFFRESLKVELKGSSGGTGTNTLTGYVQYERQA